jgi:selenocysteine lyase/cysteine desulfurase
MNYDLDTIREQIIGHDLVFDTPFGERHMLYADFTASGRGLKFIENILLEIERSYANTHTEDDYSGKFTTHLLLAAEDKIKRMINAGPHGKIIPVGSGTTGALKKLQEIIGVSIPPVTRERIQTGIQASGKNAEVIQSLIDDQRPVVFIGSYEHHTNELMWREAFVEAVVVGFNSQGLLDLDDLEKKVSAPELAHRQKIVSISAGSNITGIRTPVYDVAKIGHTHGALVFFDFAAVAPYVKIDMNRDEFSYFDAVFFSPHKFLGGPGSSGILVFNEKLYRPDLPPTTAGGGTVVFVGYGHHDFATDIEAREKAGTPPVLQTLKAALAMEVKDRIGVANIESIESEHTAYFIENLHALDNIQLIGNADPKDCIAIVSFNIRHQDRILHPKFVTKLLNDLFGIQSRAGCSCAGPFGHLLLGIDDSTSSKLRKSILMGCNGLKPGWVRINLHYTLTRDDLDFLLEAITFVAKSGFLFLPMYRFDLHSSEWAHREFTALLPDLSLDQDFSTKSVSMRDIPRLRRSYVSHAEYLAEQLQHESPPSYKKDATEIEELKYFYYLD